MGEKYISTGHLLFSLYESRGVAVPEARRHEVLKSKNNQFQDLFENFEKTAFRLETLPLYNVEQEHILFQAFLDGEPLPPKDAPGRASHFEWCQAVSASVANGKRWTRVRVLPAKIPPYIRFEIEWYYVDTSSAGEDIRLLLPNVPSNIKKLATEDFWMFDDDSVIIMKYGTKGQYHGFEPLADPSKLDHYTRLRSLMIEHSIPLRNFLSRYRKSYFIEAMPE